MAARFRTEHRWSLLYRVLWRARQGDASARMAGDVDGSELHARSRRFAARRTICMPSCASARWKMATARGMWPGSNRRTTCCHGRTPFRRAHGREQLADRDTGRWCRWNGQTLHHVRPCRRNGSARRRALPTPAANYGRPITSTFNPARLNRSVLQSNLPVRFWRNLPEGMLIPQLMSRARAGAQRDGQAERVAARQGKRIGRRPDADA